MVAPQMQIQNRVIILGKVSILGDHKSCKPWSKAGHKLVEIVLAYANLRGSLKSWPIRKLLRGKKKIPTTFRLWHIKCAGWLFIYLILCNQLCWSELKWVAWQVTLRQWLQTIKIPMFKFGPTLKTSCLRMICIVGQYHLKPAFHTQGLNILIFYMK